MLPDGMTPHQALDRVKSLRAGYNACNGSLYKNVAVGHVQEFLEKCQARWGDAFMDCVKRELTEERHGPEMAERIHKDIGIRDRVFGGATPGPERPEESAC